MSEHQEQQKEGPYFKEDDSYDRRFYENPWQNYFVIYFTIISVWLVGAIVWWGMYSFGIYNAKWMDIFNLIFFFCTLIFIAFLLCVGSTANKIKRKHLFWQE